MEGLRNRDDILAKLCAKGISINRIIEGPSSEPDNGLPGQNFVGGINYVVAGYLVSLNGCG